MEPKKFIKKKFCVIRINTLNYNIKSKNISWNELIARGYRQRNWFKIIYSSFSCIYEYIGLFKIYVHKYVKSHRVVFYLALSIQPFIQT